jgi:hypothetical protein
LLNTLKSTRLVRVFFRPDFSSFNFINLKRRIGADMEITMLNVRLPDGSSRQFDGPVTVAQVATSIAPALARPRWPARSTAKWSIPPS